MAVDIPGNLDAGVAHLFRNRLDVLAPGNHEAGTGVSQVVRAYASKPRLSQNRLEEAPPVGPVAVRYRRASARGEDQPLVLESGGPRSPRLLPQPHLACVVLPERFDEIG